MPRGEAIGSINNVFVAFYKTDGKLAYRFYFDSPKTEQIKLEGSETEEYTECTRNLKAQVSFGKYRVYSVVNCGDLDATQHDAIQTEEGLKKYRSPGAARSARIARCRDISTPTCRRRSTTR